MSEERSIADKASTEERSLADKAPEGDVAVEPAPMTVGGVLQGMRAQRRAVKIRPYTHRLADMQRLVEQIDEAPDGDEADALIDEYEAAKADFLQHQWWIVEQRTPERRRLVRREAAKVLGIEMYDDGENVVEDDADRSSAAAVEAHVIADHVVEPEGVTAEQLRALYEAAPGEYTRIDQAVVRVMRVLDEASEKDVLRDFSSRRSSKKRAS